MKRGCKYVYAIAHFCFWPSTFRYDLLKNDKFSNIKDHHYHHPLRTLVFYAHVQLRCCRHHFDLFCIINNTPKKVRWAWALRKHQFSHSSNVVRRNKKTRQSLIKHHRIQVFDMNSITKTLKSDNQIIKFLSKLISRPCVKQSAAFIRCKDETLTCHNPNDLSIKYSLHVIYG